MYNLSKKPGRRTWKKRLFASTAFFLLVGVFLLPHYAWASAINDENIIKLTNEERLKQGLGELTANQLLSKAAYDKAEAIFQTQEFKHNIDQKKFSEWVKESGYEYQSIGENLAIDFISSEGTMNAWLESPSHKKNILNPKFREIGVAVKQDKFEDQESIVVVQIFGLPSQTTESTFRSASAKQTEETATTDETENPPPPKTLLVTNTNTDTVSEISKYLPKIPGFNNQELSIEYFTQIALIILDYSDVLLMNYYYSVILLLLFVFSASYVWQRKDQEQLIIKHQ